MDTSEYSLLLLIYNNRNKADFNLSEAGSINYDAASRLADKGFITEDGSFKITPSGEIAFQAETQRQKSLEFKAEQEFDLLNHQLVDAKSQPNYKRWTIILTVLLLLATIIIGFLQVKCKN